MKKIDLGQSIGTLANVGVIAGIIFLGVELQQNNELLSEEAQRARSQAAREGWILIAENGELAEILEKDAGGEKLTGVELRRMDALWMRTLWGYQTSFLQLPREEVEAMTTYFRSTWGDMPSFHATWEQNRTTFRPAFVEFMDTNVFDR